MKEIRAVRFPHIRRHQIHRYIALSQAPGDVGSYRIDIGGVSEYLVLDIDGIEQVFDLTAKYDLRFDELIVVDAPRNKYGQSLPVRLLQRIKFRNQIAQPDGFTSNVQDIGAVRNLRHQCIEFVARQIGSLV